MTVLHGIDVSGWQPENILDIVDYDFAFVKVTESTDYVSRVADRQIQSAIRRGKLFGFYHFAQRGTNAIAEADHFIRHSKGYFGKGIPVLDFEMGAVDNGVGWAKRFLDRVYEQTGVRPLVYSNAATFHNLDWSSVAKNYGLWIANFRYHHTGHVNPSPIRTPSDWKFILVYQYSSTGRLPGYSGDLDLNVFYGDRKVWEAYVKSTPLGKTETPKPNPTKPAPKAQVKKSPAGGVHVVQSGETLSGIADRYGTTYQHLAKINNIKDPNLIFPGQKIKTGTDKVKDAPRANTHRVSAGENLTVIGQRYGKSVDWLVKNNNIKNPNLIFPGQILRVS